MSLSEKCLITLEEFRKIIMIHKDVPDEELIPQLNGASSQIQTHLGRDIVASDKVLLLDGTGRSSLKLPTFPVISISSIRVDSSRQFPEETEITGYRIKKDSGIIELYDGVVFPEGLDVVKVQCRDGYEKVPDDIKTACAILAHWRYLKIRAKSTGISSIDGDDSRISFETGWPRDVIELLKDY